MTVPFLPATLDQFVRGPKKAGTWEHYSELLDKLPDDLRIEGSVTADSLTAIPTVWARPLLFAEALFSGDAHPLNKEVVGEWRGLLGIFCFRGYYQFQLSTRSYDVSGSSSERFARVLHTLRSDSEWQTIHLIYIDNVVLGASSPKSLFFAAADYVADTALDAIPWRNKQTGRLSDPAEHFKANGMEHQLSVLRDWIEDGINELGRPSSPGDGLDKATTNELLRLLSEWKNSIPVIGEGHERALFREPLIGVPPYKYASKKALVVEKVESDFLLAATKLGSKPPIVIWEEGWKRHKEKAVFGVFRPEDVPIPQEPQGTTLARGKIRYPWIRPDVCFFTDKLLKIPLAQDRILSYHELGYLPPLKKEILEYFSPGDLEDALEWKKQDDGIQVTLKLPLKSSDGPSPANPAVISRYYKDNEIEDPWADAAGESPPFLALWPDFEILTAPGMLNRPWRHYYCICENRGAKSRLAVRPINSQSSFETREHSLLWKLSEYPEALECFTRNEPAGLILLRPPRSIPDGNGTWTVAVDFGTSNTTIFFTDGGEPHPLLLQNRWVQLTAAHQVALRFFLFTEFLPLLLQNDGAIQGIFPSHFQIFKTGAAAPEPFVDGIILFDEPVKWSEALARKNVEQNLKWTPDPNKRRFIFTFLKQVLLMIAAEARNQNVSNIKLRWSYPSAFANDMLTDFQSVWESLTRPGNEMGVAASLEFAETESVAVCKYMTFEQKARIAASTRAQIIIDVGGGTSDIAVWLAGELKAQSSILLAGNILSRYAQKQGAFASALAKITGVSQLEKLIQDPSRSAAALNLVLKRSGDAIQNALAAGENIRPEFKRARTIILFAFSAIAYYVGLILKFINQTSPIDSCDVYLAGNGAKLLKWVSSESGIQEALTAIFRISTTLTLNEITNNFPDVNKQEVARGLLYTRILPHAENVILQIVGEDGFEFDPEPRTPIPWTFNLHEQSASLNDNMVHVPKSFPELTRFLQAFDSEAAKLGLEQVADRVQAGAIRAGVEQAISDMVNKDDKPFQSFFIEEVDLVLIELINGQT